MIVYLLFECERSPWQTLDAAPAPRRILGVFADSVSAQARKAAAIGKFGVTLRIEEIELDAVGAAPLDIGCTCSDEVEFVEVVGDDDEAINDEGGA